MCLYPFREQSVNGEFSVKDLRAGLAHSEDTLQGFCYQSRKQKCCHFDEVFITGCSGSCQNDNFQCSQWGEFNKNDYISV